jgi:hypothetical protein
LVASILKTTAIDEVLRPLRAARRRLGAQFFLLTLVKAELAAGAGLLILAAVNRWYYQRLPWNGPVAAYAAIGALAVALLATVVRRQSLADTAALIDRLGGTRDRFLTALVFSDAPREEPMRALAVQECTRYVRAGKFADLIRVRLPREILWLVVPVITLGLLQWEADSTFAAREADRIAARAAVEDTAKQLEKLARETEKVSEQNKADELKKLAEQLQRSAEQLRAQATTPEEAGKSALRELSSLEQMVQDMQKSPAALTPEEMKALAKALAENEATKEAAAALAAGDQQKAAEELEKEMQKLAEQKDDVTPENVRKSIEDAIKQLAQEKQLSEAMQKLAQEMKQAGAQQQGGNSSEAAKQLAQMLRQMAQGKSGQRSGGQQSQQAMQNLLSAIQNMKFGEGQKPQSGEPQAGQAPNGVKIESFAQSQSGPPTPGDPNLPSGHPGGERDVGTTDSVFGKEKNPAGKEGQQQQIAGRMGEGDSLQQSLLSAGDNSKSHRGYKNLYEAMAPAAQDAVLQENIPLGSRFLIKRYFESIRPQE